VIEPDPAMLRAALEQVDLSAALERFTIITGLPVDLVRRRHGALLSQRVLPHPASLRVHPSYLGELDAYARALPRAAGGGLSILVVNPVYGGSLPAARHCAAALRSMGHKVTVFQSEAFAQGMEFGETFRFRESRVRYNNGLSAMLSRGVELMAREVRPDLVLALAQAPLMAETCRFLDERGIPTAFWFVEDRRVLTYWRETAPWYSYFFGIQQGEFADELARIGVSRYGYLPTCADTEVHAPLSLCPAEMEEFGAPLSFVGAGYHNRQTFFRGLTDYRFRIWGNGWPGNSPLAPHIQRNGARIDTETCVRIFNASAVNLNLHSSTCHEGVTPDGDFVNPRTFEIAACGAFQLVDRRTLMDGLFEPGELETFGDLAELRGKIELFLRDEDARRAAAARGRARVLAEHSYRARMTELLASMIAAFPHMAERQDQRLEKRREILANVEHHPGLDELLDSLPQDHWYDIDDVWKASLRKEGPLSRADRIFMALGTIELNLERVPE
jgi:spore maturation protein CgeB